MDGQGRGISRRRRSVAVVALMVGLLGGVGGLVAWPTMVAAGPACGTVPSQDNGAGLNITTASAWSCGGDLVAQTADPTNGGAAVDTTGGPRSSSSQLAVAEECADPPSNSSCGRGEFGYGGGELPSGAVALSSPDPAANGESFACPSSATGSGTGAVVAATATGTWVPPEVLLFPGNLQGGDQGKSSNFTGENECYSPYVTGSSAATGTSAPGSSYPARPATDSTIPSTSQIKGGLGATWLVPNTSGSGSNCKARVLQAGGDEGNDSTANALLYNPNANDNTMTTGFNSWETIPTPPTNYQASMVTARDTPAEVQLDNVPNAPSGDTQLLLIGGEALPSAGHYNILNSYEIFDANKCGFLTAVTSSPMNSARYDVGAAKFATGDVLVCGGVTDNLFDITNTCDLFVPNFTTSGGGSWYKNVATMAHSRGGNFAALIPASINTSQTNPSSSILMAGGTSSGGSLGTFAPDPTSDLCTEDTTMTVNGHYKVSCFLDKNGTTSAQFDARATDLGFTPQTAIGARDASHVTIGCNPAEGYVGTGSPNTSTQCNGIAKLAGETSNPSYDGLLFACGGLAGGANPTGGNDTLIDCEYYVPSGRSVPVGLSCNAGLISGPAWCVKTGLLMNRERAYFGLVEVAGLDCTQGAGCMCPTDSTPDSLWALGGFYGVPSSPTNAYLVRKNVEAMAKGGGAVISHGCPIGQAAATLASGDSPANNNQEWGVTLSASGLIPNTAYQIRFDLSDGSQEVTNNSVITDATGAISTFIDILDSGPPTSPSAAAFVHVYTTGGGGACAATAGLGVVYARADSPQVQGSPIAARDPGGGTRNIYVRQGYQNPTHVHEGYGQIHIQTARGQSFAPGTTLWNTMVNIVQNNTPAWIGGKVGGRLIWTDPSSGWYVVSDEGYIDATDGLPRGLITVAPPK